MDEYLFQMLRLVNQTPAERKEQPHPVSSLKRSQVQKTILFMPIIRAYHMKNTYTTAEVRNHQLETFFVTH